MVYGAAERKINLRKIAKIFTLLGTAFFLQAGIPGDEESVPLRFEDGPLLTAGIAHGEDLPAWRYDVDEATRDDTMAFNIYIGKSMQSFLDDFKKDGWTRMKDDNAVLFMKEKKGYMMIVAVHPHKDNKNLVGNYRIRFFTKTREDADEMYMRAEKNFAYNFGRPNVKKGTSNVTWFLNDTLSIVVEYNEYDTRMALVRGYPYEIVVKRDMGDFRKFFATDSQG